MNLTKKSTMTSTRNVKIRISETNPKKIHMHPVKKKAMPNTRNIKSYFGNPRIFERRQKAIQ